MRTLSREEIEKEKPPVAYKVFERGTIMFQVPETEEETRALDASALAVCVWHRSSGGWLDGSGPLVSLF